jgi:site-specific recombinase XerD
MSETKIRLLVESALDEMARNGASADHVRRYRKTGFGEILAHFQQIGQEEYAVSEIDEFINQIRTAYERGDASRWRWGMVRRGAELLKQFHDSGTLEMGRCPRWTLRQLSGAFSGMVEQFCEDAGRVGAIKESTAWSTKYYARQLLFEFENRGLMTFTKITPRIVNECVTCVAGRYAGGTTALLVGIRRFLRYLHTAGITEIDLSKSLPELVAPRKPVRAGFTADETERLLATADAAGVIGKRDYAMMLLATRTGLRGCDVVSIKREDIDWRTKELKIIQSKTNAALAIPLPIEAGNAIADYLLNVRPKCDEPYVFLSVNPPYRRLKRITGIVPRYIRKSDIADSIADRSGFHSFRRAAGKSLLESETSLDMLSELFGHRDMDSLKPYLAIDENGLKQCAMGLIPATIGGGLA